MKKLTSAIANKLLKYLEDEKTFIKNMEVQSDSYVLSDGEVETNKPDYDYEKVKKSIEEIDEKVLKIKHAINVFNASTILPNLNITIDVALIKMAQLNHQKAKLDSMRKKLPKVRVPSYTKEVAEYIYLNYDIDLVKKDYKIISNQIMDIQLALDRCNQTLEFEVEIEV